MTSDIYILQAKSDKLRLVNQRERTLGLGPLFMFHQSVCNSRMHFRFI